MESVRGAVATG